MKKLRVFDRLTIRWIDEVSDKRTKNNKGVRIERILDEAKEECIMALGLDVALFPIQKYHCFNKVQCKLYTVQHLLNDINDAGRMSNDGKARLDMALDDVLIDVHKLLDAMMKKIDAKGVSAELERFLSSLITLDIAGRVPRATAMGETCDLEGCLTDHEND